MELTWNHKALVITLLFRMLFGRIFDRDGSIQL